MISFFGETPSTQFIGWRLSLGNAFIILASQYVSSDGLVAWKSTKLGANFYTPNIFSKDVVGLNEVLLENNNCKYNIDIVIVSGISLDSFEKNCELLSNFTNKNTIVMVSSDFACELESIALTYFAGKCKCVLSLLCEVECRQLSLGSYALVNDDHCSMTLGISYISGHYSVATPMLQNELVAIQELQNISKSKLLKFNQLLEVAEWIKIKLESDSSKMSLKIWESIIPKISLNILSIIYEEFDYETLLKTPSTEAIFKSVVTELLDICHLQCESMIEQFEDADTISFDRIIEYTKQKDKELVSTTTTEHPEYLSLPFEAYCFYHRFEYPAHILLYQQIELARNYNTSYSSLNFLFGFYSRLLSLSGLSITGGRLEQNVTMFNNRLSINIGKNELEKDEKKPKKVKKDKGNKSSKKRHNKEKKKERKPKEETLKPKLDGTFNLSSATDPNITAELETLYLGIESFTDFHFDSPSNMPINQIDGENLLETDEEESSEFSETDDSTTETDSGSENRNIPGEHSEKSVYFEDDELFKEFNYSNFQGITSTSSLHNKSISLPSLRKQQVKLESHGVVNIPHFNTKLNNIGGGFYDLETQIRTSQHLMTQEYRNFFKSLFDNNPYLVEDGLTKREVFESRQQQFANQRMNFWKRQRHFNVTRGTIPRPKTTPYEDLLNHVSVLNKGNTGDILPYTTSRYGEVDTYSTLKRSKEDILMLFGPNAGEDDSKAIKDSNE
ncbi:hypothetical protein KAFR_0D01030 [Kazachstania africana CBS 2517]|uniref:Uncharacterized protein n=1 Tax=Kazachstania africana (strain ATCC 22294 / BCRC 22015 / CBS 2517 / CECT 1963 / NBRC 1671 / NRRL Y-8276) TaxID=1071382 RepID=H2ATQ0_KAZAF|nr:hypothetical protein KAFR_0D01030 [Kazachstania africana CBS 2517]CCF57750.1 hypothetical protein KAFR_0D01030 [Kazachstania africana CBS 2517]